MPRCTSYSADTLHFALIAVCHLNATAIKATSTCGKTPSGN